MHDLVNHGVIIGGCGRSGTSLLLSMLSCHPALACIPKETYAFYDYPTKSVHQPFMMERIHEALDALPRTPDHRFFVEKTPKNVHAFDELLASTSYKLIHIVRDGRDVILSKHPQALDRFWVEPQRWIDDVTAGMKHETNPRVHTMRYEDLILDTSTTLQTLCEFIGIPHDDATFDYPTNATVKTYNGWCGLIIEAHPLDALSIGKWKNPQYAERVKELTDDPRAWELLKHFGYA